MVQGWGNGRSVMKMDNVTKVNGKTDE